MGGVLPGEREVFFHKFDPYALTGERLDDPAKVVEISGKPVHAMDDYRVAGTHKAHKKFELGALGVFA